MWRRVGSEFLRIRANSAFVVDLAEKLHVCLCAHMHTFGLCHLGILDGF